MKTKKLCLDTESDEIIELGLWRLVKDLVDYEFFFALNKVNGNIFYRTDDLVRKAEYYHYNHHCFEAYHQETRSCFQFISNRSNLSTKQREITELFTMEQPSSLLLPEHPEVDYIIKSSDPYPDFSLILWPENLVFQTQPFSLSSSEELYHLISYYE